MDKKIYSSTKLKKKRNGLYEAPQISNAMSSFKPSLI